MAVEEQLAQENNNTAAKKEKKRASAITYRKGVIMLLSILVEKSNKFMLVYRLLLIIEFFQSLYFIISPNIVFMFDINFFLYLQTFTSYLNFIPLLTMRYAFDFMLYAIVVVNVFVLAVCAAAPFFINYLNSKIFGGTTSAVVTSICFYVIVFQSILIIPFSQIGILGMYCSSNHPYYDPEVCLTGSRFQRFVLGFLIQVMIIIQLVCTGVYFISLNPLNQGICSSYRNVSQLLHNLMKLLVPIFTIVDPSGIASVAYLIIYIIVLGFIFCYDIVSPPQSNSNISVQKRINDAILLVFAASVMIQATYNTRYNFGTNIALIYILVIVLIIVVLTYRFEKRRRLLLSKSLKNLDSKATYTLILLIEKCNKSFYKNILLTNINYLLHLYRIEDSKSILTGANLNINDFKTTCYSLLLRISKLEGKRIDTYTRLLLAYIMMMRLGLRWLVIYEKEEIEEKEKDMRILSSIYTVVNILENEKREYDIRNKDDTNGTVNLDMFKIMEYQKINSHLKDKIKHGFIFYNEFYNMLLEREVRISLLKKLGNRIIRLNEDIKSSMNTMMERNIIGSRLIYIYMQYMKQVVNDKDEGERIENKNNGRGGLSAMSRGGTLGDGRRMSIIVVNGNKNQIGMIENINNEILKMFNYTNEDVARQNNISMFMPHIFALYHHR